MERLFSALLVLSAVFLAIPVAVFFIEVLAAVALPKRSATANRRRNDHRVAVLVPAHNESTGVLATLADIKHQLLPGDRLVVVADNCNDDTATLASNAGAEVIERHDLTRIGKGFALDFGIQHLRLNPPNIVILLDADCRLATDAINQLAATCAETGRPVQALYLMTQPEQSAINHRVAEFAWRLKNWIRPLGLNALGLPCQLMGTGMAVPWEVIGSVNVASGRIVEDLQLGLDLAKAGHFPIFCPAARVSSEFASSATGAVTQRERWEHGHIGTILNMGPQLAWQALRQRNKELLALTLDLAVPPLSFLVILVAGMLLLSALGAFFGLSATAMFISFASVSALLLAIILAWLKCGRSVLPLGAIFSIVPYVTAKIGLYGRILARRMEARWIRTDRTKSR